MARELDDETLQRYYDGELSPVEERSVRARVEKDPEAQAELAQLARLSEMMQTAAEEMGSGLDADGMFAAIEQGERFRVIRSEWVEHKKGVVVPLVAATAVAAAALFTVAGPAPKDETTFAGNDQPPVTVKPQPPAPQVHGTQVEDVDFGSNTGTVFQIESKGIATAVVWIADEEEDTEDEEAMP